MSLWSLREDLHRDFDASVGADTVDVTLDLVAAEHATANVTRFSVIFIEQEVRAALGERLIFGERRILAAA